VAQVRRARAETPGRTVRFTPSLKAVFSPPEKPNPRPRDCEICSCPEAHHVRDAHQLAPKVSISSPGRRSDQPPPATAALSSRDDFL
jgi:hypothetical protein